MGSMPDLPAAVTLAPEDVAALDGYIERCHDWRASAAERAVAREELAAYLAACLRYPRPPLP
jgi:hypothetical protein